MKIAGNFDQSNKIRRESQIIPASFQKPIVMGIPSHNAGRDISKKFNWKWNNWPQQEFVTPKSARLGWDNITGVSHFEVQYRMKGIAFWSIQTIASSSITN